MCSCYVTDCFCFCVSVFQGNNDCNDFHYKMPLQVINSGINPLAYALFKGGIIAELKGVLKKQKKLKTNQNKLTSQKFQLEFMIDPMSILQRSNLHFQTSFFFLHVVCIYLFKFFCHPISFCPTSLGIANLLTALAVSRLANPEANLGALVICFCTFDTFRKATWLMCSTIFHLIWRFAWKYHYSL